MSNQNNVCQPPISTEIITSAVGCRALCFFSAVIVAEAVSGIVLNEGSS